MTTVMRFCRRGAERAQWLLLPDLSDLYALMNPPLPRPENLINRELGFLAFNRRILELAADIAVPLLERLRYLCIVSSNLDEFFEIRVAGLREQIKYDAPPGADGMPLHAVYQAVARETQELVRHQYQLLNDEILPGLDREGIRFLRRNTWDEAQKAWAHDHFRREILPVLTPIGLDPSHPFPSHAPSSLPATSPSTPTTTSRSCARRL